MKKYLITTIGYKECSIDEIVEAVKNGVFYQLSIWSYDIYCSTVSPSILQRFNSRTKVHNEISRGSKKEDIKKFILECIKDEN